MKYIYKRHCDEWSERDCEEAIQTKEHRKHRLPRRAPPHYAWGRLLAMTKFKQRGFSLVELAVVLVIAGIALAGIMSGTHLLQAAKLDKVVSEISGYVTAVNNFKDKYNAWPGDMENATSYWGTYAAGPPITGANNGNGDEQISGASTESLYAWRHMFLAGMVSGGYTGADAGTPDFQAGVNLPASSVPGAYYLLYRHINHLSTTGNALQLSTSNVATEPWGSALTPADAHIIDVKMDDGLADSGNFYTWRGNEYTSTAGRCIDAHRNDPSGNYILTDTVVSCRMNYWLNKE